MGFPAVTGEGLRNGQKGQSDLATQPLPHLQIPIWPASPCALTFLHSPLDQPAWLSTYRRGSPPERGSGGAVVGFVLSAFLTTTFSATASKLGPPTPRLQHPRRGRPQAPIHPSSAPKELGQATSPTSERRHTCLREGPSCSGLRSRPPTARPGRQGSVLCGSGL